LREKAVEKLVDQAALVELAGNQSNPSGVRWRAVERISDQRLLADLAKHDNEHSVRISATERLRFTDQRTLVDIACGGRYGERVSDSNCEQVYFLKDAAYVAIEWIDNQGLLREIATTAIDPQARAAAVNKLTHQVALAAIAKNDSDPVVRSAAIRNLTNRVALVEVARADAVEWVRRVALEKLGGG
jgi:hypothetical protein